MLKRRGGRGPCPPSTRWVCCGATSHALHRKAPTIADWHPCSNTAMLIVYRMLTYSLLRGNRVHHRPKPVSACGVRQAVPGALAAVTRGGALSREGPSAPTQPTTSLPTLPSRSRTWAWWR